MAMKILITGKNSFIGSGLEDWLYQFGSEYQIDKISLRDKAWEKLSFGGYDVVVHVAGIAHVSSDPRLEEAYFAVNRDLAVRVAEKAKADKVPHFIFTSSIIIYDGSETGKAGIINLGTVPKANGFYGQSKLDADFAIQRLSEDCFRTLVIRMPMVYGKGCKGNFMRLQKFTKFAVFPSYVNCRSMIYIENLCEYLRLAIDKRLCGVAFPQNAEYVSTRDIVTTMAEMKGKKIILVGVMNPFIGMMAGRVRMIGKIFGNKVYDKGLSDFKKFDYNKVSFKESIQKSTE